MGGRTAAGTPPDWAWVDVAVPSASRRLPGISDGGYVDQPHLHREVAAFARLTPAALATAPWLSIDATAWPTPLKPVRRAVGDPSPGRHETSDERRAPG